MRGASSGVSLQRLALYFVGMRTAGPVRSGSELLALPASGIRRWRAQRATLFWLRLAYPSSRGSDVRPVRPRSRNISIRGRTPRVARSWLALAGAADHRYTMEMLPALLQSKTPKLPVWGEDDGFQTGDYAERYEREIPKTRLVRIKSAGHIPMENNPNAVAGALAEFFAAER